MPPVTLFIFLMTLSSVDEPLPKNVSQLSGATSNYSLTWVSIASGGASTATTDDGSVMKLRAAIGQPVTGVAEVDAYSLEAGIPFGEDEVLFGDGFESCDVSAWSDSTAVTLQCAESANHGTNTAPSPHIPTH